MEAEEACLTIREGRQENRKAQLATTSFQEEATPGEQTRY